MLAGSIANAKLLNSSVTIGTTAIALGGSATTLAGLTSVTSTTFVGALTGNASTATSATSATTAGSATTATTATNIAGGAAGAVLYQSASGTTASLAGTSGQVLMSQGGNIIWITPNYVAGNTAITAGTYKSVTVDTKGLVTGGTNPTTLAGYGITDAANIAGSASQAFSASTFTGALSGNASSATTASGLTSATTIVSVSAATAPTTGQVLTATSATTATWQTVAGGGGLTTTDDTTTNATYYPTFVTTVAGSTAKMSSTKLTFNPSTGSLFSTEFLSSSDERLKDNIATLENNVETIKAIRPVSFNWKENGKKSYGVIAQELEMILPELVEEAGDYKRVKYDALVGFLLGAVQELSARVEALESK
jgi:hypothetical protein